MQLSSPGLVECSSGSSYAVWRDVRGLLLSVPLAHYFGHLGENVKGQKVYYYTGPIGVITSQNNAHILMPDSRCTILTRDECIQAKELEAVRDCILSVDRPEKSIANAVTKGLTKVIYRFAHSVIMAKDRVSLLTHGNQTLQHYQGHAACLMRAIGELDAPLNVNVGTLSYEVVMPHTALTPFLEFSDSDDDAEPGGELAQDVSKRKQLTAYPESHYEPLIPDTHSSPVPSYS